MRPYIVAGEAEARLAAMESSRELEAHFHMLPINQPAQLDSSGMEALSFSFQMASPNACLFPNLTCRVNVWLSKQKVSMIADRSQCWRIDGLTRAGAKEINRPNSQLASQLAKLFHHQFSRVTLDLLAGRHLSGRERRARTCTSSAGTCCIVRSGSSRRSSWVVQFAER